ncbi:MAG: OmpA family protein [Pyrinomonadaceae bacterium]|nr:OmpA family protein [Pyrinomonadaceae bacterium]
MRTRQFERKNSAEGQNRDRWLISYADLVTLLLALFIVLYAASDHERAKQIAQSFSDKSFAGEGILPENAALVGPRERLEEKFRSNPVLSSKTSMSQTSRGFVVSLSEAGFFAPGDAAVSAEAKQVLDEISSSINETEFSIRVEGHTDSVPISNSKYPSNWELSTARASSVLIRLMENGIAPERLSAAGYGGFQPVADNSTPEGRAKNRRVDVVILNR